MYRTTPRTTSCVTSWRLLALGLLIFAALTTPVLAATVSYNTSGGIAVPSVGGILLPQWDPALFPGQTLIGIDLYIDAGIGANITAENDSAANGNMGVSLIGTMSASGPGGLSPIAIINAAAGPVLVGPTDGNPDAGPDFHDFGPVSGVDTDLDSIAAHPAYIGNGTVSITLNANGGFTVTGVTDSSLTVSGFAGDFFVEVTYLFVPEPSTVALLSLGLLGMVGMVWRRRRKA